MRPQNKKTASAHAPLKIWLTTAELAPLAKTGGLADVCAALSAWLHREGHDVRVLMPRYASLDTGQREIKPVTGLQDLPMKLGTWRGRYSVDVVHLPGEGQPVYLLRCPEFYDRDEIYTTDDDEHRRFLLLSRASIEICQHLGFGPDIFHCHDWHTALIPLFLRTRYAWDKLFGNSRTVLTIHNIGYQGVVSADLLDDLELAGGESELDQDDLARGQINFMKAGVLHADLLTTVSPTYAREIQGQERGMGLDALLRQRSESLVGILNGVDYDEWNPAVDPLIPANYSRDDLAGKAVCKSLLLEEMKLYPGSRPLIGMITRLASQKGIDLVQKVLPDFLAQRDFAMVVLGSGDEGYQRFFEWLEAEFSGRVGFFNGYSAGLAHRIEAGSDMFLMPSWYEPCGLNQMYSLRYGSVPVVRETGGLADSVQHFDPATGTGDGIVFRDYDETGLAWGIGTALDYYEDPATWRSIVQNGMAKNFSWEVQGARYVELFRALVGS